MTKKGPAMTGRSGPAMAVFVTPDVFVVTPDVIGRLLLIVTPDVIGRRLMPAGKRLPVGAGNDKKGAGNDGR